MGISLKPSDAVTGGLFQDVDVTVAKSRAAIYDYNGKSAKPALAVHMTLETTDGATTEEVYYSVGALDRFSPSETSEGNPLTNLGDEGKFIVPSEGSTATALSKSSNFMFFLSELLNAGFPEDRIESGDVSVFEGMTFHAIRKPAPKREGLAQQDTGGAPRRESTVLVASKILKFPWDGKAKAKGAVAGGGRTGQDVNAVAVAAIKEVLGKSGGSISPADAKKVAFPSLVKNKDLAAIRNDVLALLVNEEWLAENQGDQSGFAYDGTVITSL